MLFRMTFPTNLSRGLQNPCPSYLRAICVELKIYASYELSLQPPLTIIYYMQCTLSLEETRQSLRSLIKVITNSMLFVLNLVNIVLRSIIRVSAQSFSRYSKRNLLLCELSNKWGSDKFLYQHCLDRIFYQFEQRWSLEPFFNLIESHVHRAPDVRFIWSITLTSFDCHFIFICDVNLNLWSTWPGSFAKPCI